MWSAARRISIGNKLGRSSALMLIILHVVADALDNKFS
jgi:hypothetical protein